MREKIIRAILKKEMLEVIRSYKIYILLTIFYSMFLEWFIVRNYVSIIKKSGGLATTISSDLLRQGVATSLIYMAPITITFIGNLFMTRNFIRERFSGALMTLLATGITQNFIWKVKLAASFLFGYAVYLICIFAEISMIAFHFKIILSWSFNLIITIFLISPIASLSIMAILSVIYWTIRPAQIVASTLPTVLVLSIWAFVSRRPQMIELLTISMIALIISVLIISICSIIIKMLRRGLIVGL